MQTDPHFRDYVLFHEYFHGDTGRGVGASHQTGWTGLIAKLLQPQNQKIVRHGVPTAEHRQRMHETIQEHQSMSRTPMS